MRPACQAGLLLLLAVTSLPAAEPFKFAALGCMPYARNPGAAAAFTRTLAEIDRQKPAFAVHLGDTLGSDEKCTDDLLQQRLRDFNSVAGALIYTPGDNEWTDTHHEKAGSYNPLERLAKIRAWYFAVERSLGRSPIPLVTQRRDPKFARFVENARWTHGGVVFATVHVVGSHNNHQPQFPGAMEEWAERDAANEAWVRAAFAEARATSAPGLALFFQAAPFGVDRGRPDADPGFARFLRTVETEARALAKPVLLVHADEHRYRLDVGMRFTAGAEPVPNVTRLETFGAQNFHAVLVTVDPDSIAVFSAGPLIVPGNPVPVLPRPKTAK
ncbi:MAG: hypothetical protein HZC55_07350 [Verrucomicrobia bacterium]|nr:hypothetical protein [Verrucomicrobiota bacterium]